MTKKQKQNYKINETNRTIKADWKKLSKKEKEEVKELVELGYKFQNKSSRDGSKRTIGHYESNLYSDDLKIFNDLRNVRNEEGKTVKGAYAKASCFATTIIKLGKFVDKHPEKEEVLDEYRLLVISDFAKAKVYAKNVLAAA